MQRDLQRSSILAYRISTVLLLCACSSGPAPWHGDATFTAEERTAIEEGHSWIASHVGREPAAIEWDAPHVSDGTPCPDGSICKREGSVNGRVAWTERQGASIEFHVATTVIAAHEFGHWYGLMHHDGRGVMNPDAPELVWTKADEDDCLQHVANGSCAGASE